VLLDQVFEPGFWISWKIAEIELDFVLALQIGEASSRQQHCAARHTQSTNP
jgi:hypothetical protein